MSIKEDIQRLKEDIQRVDHAIDTLKEHGYYVNNLWHIEDVTDRWECDEETALSILEDAMENESIYEQIWCSIDNVAFHRNLKQIKLPIT